MEDEFEEELKDSSEEDSIEKSVDDGNNIDENNIKRRLRNRK